MPSIAKWPVVQSIAHYAGGLETHLAIRFVSSPIFSPNIMNLFFPLLFFSFPFCSFFLWWDAASLSEGLEKKQARGWSPEQEIHQSVAFEQTITWPYCENFSFFFLFLLFSRARAWRGTPKRPRLLGRKLSIKNAHHVAGHLTIEYHGLLVPFREPRQCVNVDSDPCGKT